MRLLARLLLAAALTTPPAVVALASCSTGAAGVSACTTIEDYRCQIAPLCTTSFNVDQCVRFYRDQCLNGIQNNTGTVVGADGGTVSIDPNALAGGCVSALQAAAGCASDGGADDLCPAVPLVPGATCASLGTSTPSACQLILDCPEMATACNFLEAPPDGGADATADADSTADAGNVSDAASE